MHALGGEGDARAVPEVAVALTRAARTATGILAEDRAAGKAKVVNRARLPNLRKRAPARGAAPSGNEERPARRRHLTGARKHGNTCEYGCAPRRRFFAQGKECAQGRGTCTYPHAKGSVPARGRCNWGLQEPSTEMTRPSARGYAPSIGPARGRVLQALACN